MLFELLKYFMENLATAFEDKQPGFPQKKGQATSQPTIFPLKVKLPPGVGELSWNVGWSTPDCTNGKWQLSYSTNP